MISFSLLLLLMLCIRRCPLVLGTTRPMLPFSSLCPRGRGGAAAAVCFFFFQYFCFAFLPLFLVSFWLLLFLILLPRASTRVLLPCWSRLLLYRIQPPLSRPA